MFTSGVCLVYEIPHATFENRSKVVPPCEHTENKPAFSFCPTCGVRNNDHFESEIFQRHGKPVRYQRDTISSRAFPELGFVNFGNRSVVRTFFRDKLFIIMKKCPIPSPPREHSFTGRGQPGYTELDLSDRTELCEALKKDLAGVGVDFDEGLVKIVVFPPAPEMRGV